MITFPFKSLASECAFRSGARKITIWALTPNSLQDDPFRGRKSTAILKQTVRHDVRPFRQNFPWAQVHGYIEAIIASVYSRQLTSFPWAQVHGYIEAEKIITQNIP